MRVLGRTCCVVRRCWPGLVAFGVTLGALGFTLGPLPRSRVGLEAGGPTRFRQMFGPGPAGQPCLIRGGYLAHPDLGYYDARTGELLLDFRGKGPLVEDLALADDGTLTYVERVPEEEPVKAHVACVRGRQRLWAREYVLPSRGEGAFPYWWSYGRSFSKVALSCDGSALVVPVARGDAVGYELVDNQTGTSRRLELPALAADYPRHAGGACFTEAGSLLVTVHAGGESGRWTLHRLDVETGRDLGSTPLPSAPFNVLYASESLVVMETYPHDRVIVATGPPWSARYLVFEEIAPQRQVLPEKWKGHMTVASSDFYVDPRSRDVLAFWTYCFPGQHAASGYLPGWHYALRRVEGGQLLGGGMLQKPPNLEPEPMDPVKKWQWRMRDIHPDVEVRGMLRGPVAVTTSPEPEAEPGPLQRVEAWLHERLGWDQHRGETVWFLDTRRGERTGTLRLPGVPFSLVTDGGDGTFSVVCTRYHPGKRNEDVLVTYDYPLHKPWWLILGWSSGVGLIVTVLVESSRLASRCFGRRRAARLMR